MIDVDIRLFGVPEVQRALRQLPTAYSEQALKSALRAAAVPVRKEMARRAPVRTGNLRKSIGIEVLRRGALSVAVGARRAPWKGYHIHLVEFGTRHSRARPFIAQAWRAAESMSMSKLVAQLERALAAKVRALAARQRRFKI